MPVLCLECKDVIGFVLCMFERLVGYLILECLTALEKGQKGQNHTCGSLKQKKKR